MALIISKRIRRFKFGSLTLQDPDPAKTPDQVREYYAELYPDLTNAGCKGPVNTKDAEEYTFERSIGDKG